VSQFVGYLYTAALAGLAVYGLHIITLITLYLLHRHRPLPSLPGLSRASLPYVTVQIPLRNERNVVRRVLRAAGGMEWPRDRLTIQVLDDSDDETTSLARAEAAKLRLGGLNVEVIHRKEPRGHKAGALAEGLRQARGEFIALFDADFCPPPDFLNRTVPYLIADPGLGMVQARWGHLNADESAITRVQALLLDAHFTVEHLARNRSGLLMNFNGTAGVWRRRTIEEAGGWQSDTVAEDLDLSYRAQLGGWRALYLPDVVAGAELPPLIGAFKQQQYRWAKGAAQVLRKLGGRVLRSPRLNPAQKAMALLHLSGYLTQPLFLLMLILTLPMALLNPALPQMAAFLGTIMAVPPLLYLLGQRALYRDWARRFLAYPFLMLLGMGLAWTNTVALVDGLIHWGGPFVRTPKFRLHGSRARWQGGTYAGDALRVSLTEMGLAAYALLALALTLHLGRQSLLPLALVSAGGEGLMLGVTLLQRHMTLRARGSNP
jgi:cellulose synthase/poly-beta-1,6-N-acetylglucosamine synthase-like glycosyltransferase